MDRIRRRLADLVRAPAGVDRLVPSPVLLIGDPAAVEALLALLARHPAVCALPALPQVRVRLERSYSPLAMQKLGLTEPELGHLLADRLVQRELARAGARVVVAVAPEQRYAELRAAWPEAREVRVAPGAVRQRSRPRQGSLRVAAAGLDRDPEAVLRAVERFLGLPATLAVPQPKA